MGKVTESIYSSATVIVPLADVQHIEKHKHGLVVVTSHTRWDHECYVWANNIWIGANESEAFCRAFCTYRAELESDTLMDLRPDAHNC